MFDKSPIAPSAEHSFFQLTVFTDSFTKLAYTRSMTYRRHPHFYTLIFDLVSNVAHGASCMLQMRFVPKKQFFCVYALYTRLPDLDRTLNTRFPPTHRRLFHFIPSIIMKVLVGVKRVVDYAVKVRVTKGNVDLGTLKHSINPFCEVRYC